MDSANAASAPSPSKSSSLPTRIASAVVPLPAILLVTWLGGPAVALTCVALLVLSLRELYAMIAAAGYRPRLLVGGACAALLLVAAIIRGFGGPDLSGFALAAAIMLSLLAELAILDRELTLPSWALTLAGSLYIGWFVSHLMLMRAIAAPPLVPAPLGILRIEPGAAWIYTALGITWANDIAAYLVGRRFGRHRMSPYISPQKSWEGLAGGMLGAVAGAFLLKFLLGLPLSALATIVVGLVGGAAGVCGDLAESLIKRQSGVKDSGTLIPGHGGLLDRIDSLLFVTPTLYYLIVLLAR